MKLMSSASISTNSEKKRICVDADDMSFMNNNYYETENTHTGESETESETDDERDLRYVYVGKLKIKNETESETEEKWQLRSI